MPPKGIAAVLFDMDGVLINSMPFHFEAWHGLFERLGIQVSRNEILRREGEQGAVTIRDILHSHGVRCDEERVGELLEEKEAWFRRIARPALYDGTEEFLDELVRKGVKLALITGTSRSEVEGLAGSGVLETFDAIVTGDGVARGKPAPDPYLKAMDRLGIGAAEGVAVENAPYGITSAVAAGLYCIAIETSLPRDYLLQAHRIVADHEELRAFILNELFSHLGNGKINIGFGR